MNEPRSAKPLIGATAILALVVILSLVLGSCTQSNQGSGAAPTTVAGTQATSAAATSASSVAPVPSSTAPFSSAASGAATATTTSQSAAAGGAAVSYNPPKPEDAPENIRDAVMLGYNLVHDTQQYGKQYVGNKLSCENCHFNAGINQAGKNGGLSLVGIAATYPKYRSRAKYSTDLASRTTECFERSMNGKSPAADSKDMTAMITYYQWIAKGLPIYGDIPWLGIKALQSSHKPDAQAGQQVYAQNCAACHGAQGQGQGNFPPLWGNNSYNDGAGMSNPATLAAFAHLNMPRGNPILTVEQALDVGEYVDSQPRPHFTAPTH